MLKKLTFILLLFNLTGKAQLSGPKDVQVKMHYGYLMAHRSVMQHLVQGHVSGFEINLEKQVIGTRDFERLFARTNWGLGLTFLDLGNKEQLGSAITPFTYLNFPLLKKSNALTLRLGAGPGFITKPFDNIENHKNIAIGSVLNINANITLEGKFEVNNFTFGGGLTFNHFSNGSFTVPNLGINIPSLNLSVAYLINKKHSEGSPNFDLPPIKKDTTWKLDIIATTGIKEVYPINDNKYVVGNLYLWASKMFGYKSGFVGGLDFMFNPSIRKTYQDAVENPSNIGVSVFRPGAIAGYQFRYNKLELSIHLGAYLWSVYNAQGPMYHRIGGRYAYKNGLMWNFSLKTHYAKADYFEFGLGYRFIKK